MRPAGRPAGQANRRFAPGSEGMKKRIPAPKNAAAGISLRRGSWRIGGAAAAMRSQPPRVDRPEASHRAEHGRPPSAAAGQIMAIPPFTWMVLAGDPGCLVGGEIDHRRRDILRRAITLRRDARHQRGLLLIVQCVGHRGLHEAGGHHVHRHAARRHLPARATSTCRSARPSPRSSSPARIAGDADDGRDGHDPPVPLLHHPAQRGARQAEGAVRSTSSTAFQSASPMRSASMSRVKPALLTRMSSPPASLSIFSPARGCRGVGQVGGRDDHPLPAQRLRHAGEFRLAPAGDGDGRTLGMQGGGDGLADAAGGAGGRGRSCRSGRTCRLDLLAWQPWAGGRHGCGGVQWKRLAML